MSSCNFWLKKIKDKGFRFTETRATILKIFLNTPVEKNAEEIYKIASAIHPEIGIATVYRNINILEKIGAIRCSGIIKNKLKYILNEVDINEVKKDSNISDSLEELKELNKIKDQISKKLIKIDQLKKKKEIKLEKIVTSVSDINEIMKKHDFQKSNLIQMFIDVQTDYNWLPKYALHHISKKLDIPLTNIYSIASFYKFFNLEPRGKHSITVCTGTACHVRGATNLLQRIVNVLGVKPGDTTEDLKFTLDTVNCLGVCALGPVMMVDNQYHSNPSIGKLKKIFSKF